MGRATYRDYEPHSHRRGPVSLSWPARGYASGSSASKSVVVEPLENQRGDRFHLDVQLKSGVHEPLRQVGLTHEPDQLLVNVLGDSSLLGDDVRLLEGVGGQVIQLRCTLLGPVYFPAAGQEPIVTGAPDGSYERWREMGFDAHSIIADPGFVDVPGGDYRLRPESPTVVNQQHWDRLGPEKIVIVKSRVRAP